jgi:glycosyltransferase involved in cell wall biosynthesis
MSRPSIGAPLRVLQVYNEYRRHGGEDTVVDLEAALLRRNGHAVECLRVSTRELERAGKLRLLAAGFGTAWSFRGYAAMKEAIARFSPDIVHAHNTFPLLSPSVFWAAHRAGVPVVQTLHNFRLTCANALLLRDSQPCQKCVGQLPWAGLRHRCFGSSYCRTAAVTSSNLLHRWLGTFQNKIHAYIALTEFSREVMTRAGLPPERLYVKPNFAPDLARPAQRRLKRVVFAGIIARFKGVHILLDAWTRLAPADYQLALFGDGPDRIELERRYVSQRNIIWCGTKSRDQVIEQMGGSRWVVLPSLVYENFPMTVLEALSVGTPVVVPNHGAFARMVTDRQEGLMFSPGNAESLAEAFALGFASPESSWARWSANARNKFVAEFTESSNYPQLMAIYQGALQTFRTSRGRARGREMRRDRQTLVEEIAERQVRNS